VLTNKAEEAPIDLEKPPVQEEAVEEEEEYTKQMTLEEYMAQKKKANYKLEARKPE